ncbi:hypothetical protein Pla110_30740 [Polystyrenella longa]|uniref:Uncharacterized protein n=1 Tax=Polystyrenella longa TaxID=2528007 RepID=A0A518CQ23_9PLAN|nr:hypothetical protein [Polystyrenella longa]QDU81333.1 hypothetical protein Pla110_30740 [Polystyrenella longa]
MVFHHFRKLFERFITDSKQNSPEDVVDFVEELLSLGYLKYAQGEYHSTIKEQLISSVKAGAIITDWDDDCVGMDRRSYPADNEALAEGAIGECIRLMVPVLKAENICVDLIADHFDEDRYTVEINGNRHLIYTQQYVEQSIYHPDGADIWTVALMRLLEVLNSMFEEVGSSERVFAHMGGNDGRIIVISEEMYQHYLRHIELFERSEKLQTASEVRSELHVDVYDMK